MARVSSKRKVIVPTLYAILGVAPGATLTAIHAEYRELAKMRHPDLPENTPADAERFKDVALAYGILRDEARREKYNTELRLMGRLNCDLCGGNGERVCYVKMKKQMRRCEVCGGTGECITPSR